MTSAAEDLSFYAAPGPMTALTAVDPTLLVELPASAEELCGVSQGLIVHEFLAAEYGVEDAPGRVEELETRAAADIVALIDRSDPQHRPLVRSRPPEHRVIGNCRQFSVLTCALLRSAGIPARARTGFADYFDDTWTDHWVIERWDAEQEEWVRSDPQLDDLQRRKLGFDFDPLRLPDGRFLSGGEAWQRCRQGEDDPNRFGIADMRGLWFIAGAVVRDLAALEKVEVLPWDTWGVMDSMFGPLAEPTVDLVDEMAAVVVSGASAERQRMYQRPGVSVPDVVRSQRFQRDVKLPAVAAN